MMTADTGPETSQMREELRQLRDYWAGKCRPDGQLPRRADIDPLEMRFALGHLILTDVEPGARPRFRHRLIGTHIVERAGYDATGRYLDEIPETELAARAADSYARVLVTKRPVWQILDDIVDGRSTKLELMRLPLASDGENVDMVLSAAYFDRAA
jgi:hypothetical protein